MTLDPRQREREDGIRRLARSIDVSEDHLLSIWRTAEETREHFRPDQVEEVARHVLWHRGDFQNGYQPGQFTTTLMVLWDRADSFNKARLAIAFPLMAHAISLGKSGGDELLKSWAGIA